MNHAILDQILLCKCQLQEDLLAVPQWNDKSEGNKRKQHGNNARYRIEFATINLSDLNEFFKDGDVVTPEILKERGIIKKQLSGVKVLGNGELKKKLTIRANRFSSAAVTKIESAGGKAEVI